MKTENIRVVLATDCGSTTSKARLFMKKGEEYRFAASGEAPTTVEAPYEDVRMGVRNAVREVEELTGMEFLSPDGDIITPYDGAKRGADLYVTTSSAGGGLQMNVCGVVKIMTAESAERAALGAGAIVMDVMSVDDGRKPYEKIRQLRFLRPDMILIAGGTDGGTLSHVAETAELISEASPRARLGSDYRLPIVYAGNKYAVPTVTKILGEQFALKVVDNIRPVLEVEIVEPARAAIHELFMEHVMAHAPGYDKLMKWTAIPILPTPAAEGMMMQLLSQDADMNLIGVGLGGATTNIYSVYEVTEAEMVKISEAQRERERKFVRTVSANLGMSYSMCNVMKEAGIENILRWLPFEIDQNDVENRLRNKMIRPTTIPHTMEDLLVEHAVAREALRMALQHHMSLARGLRGVTRGGAEGLKMERKYEFKSYIDMMQIEIIAGTGGLLSRAPRRAQSAMVLIDGFRPEGVTRLFQDSVFMIPHLGVLSTVHPAAALEVFKKDCLVPLGTCITPAGAAKAKGDQAVSVTVMVDPPVTVDVAYGAMKVVPLESGRETTVKIDPSKGFNVGEGDGKEVEAQVMGGVVGIIIDARGRPLEIAEDIEERINNFKDWFKALDVYPDELLERLMKKE